MIASPPTLPTPAAARDPFAVDFGSPEITGVVRGIRIVGDNDFTIVALDGDRTAVGELGEEDGDLSAGVAYRFFGRWLLHDKHGEQFKFDSFTRAARQAQMGVVVYLARSKVGLTKSDAMRLWSAYGADAIDRLRDAPADVVADGVLTDRDDGKKAFTASALLRDMENNEPTKIALFELFASRGFPRSTVKACVATWGPRAPAIVRRDPFCMLVRDIAGVGFKRADKLYLDLGGNPTRLKRQMLAAWHAMHVSGSGNTWEVEGLLHKAILQAAGSFVAGEFDRAITLGVRAGWLRTRTDADGTWYAECDNAAAEERLARHVARIRAHRPIWPAIDTADLADDHQRGKLAEIAGSAVAILAGTPGTGKTFAAAVLIRKLLTFLPSGRVAVCAPTGKAAVRITEAMRRNNLPLQATTIHQLLEVDGSTKGDSFKFRRNESRPLDASVVVIDEGSMGDTALVASLFAAIPAGGNVLIVGDPYQLPPVGHGAPLRDLIAADVPTAMLTEIKRNNGAIVRACAAIKDGKRFDVFSRVDESAGANLIHVQADNEDAQLQSIVSLVGAVRTRGLDPMWECQVLVATNEKSRVSRRPLNVVLQNVLNPQDDRVPADARNPIFRPADKVICLKNTEVALWEATAGPDGELGGSHGTDITCYRKSDRLVYVANGDMGRVLAVDAKSAVVQFLLPDRIVKVTTAKRKAKDGDGDGGADAVDLAEFDLAYAVTVHKSQGSEWPIVIMVIDENAGPIGCREWWYTAISRAGRIGFLVGRMGMAYRQAARVNLQRRKTFLKELLTEGVPR